MNTLNPAEGAVRQADAAATVLIWDAPVRVVHWLLALSFAGAWLSAESERLHLVHITLGYTMAGLVVLRLIWGWIGSSPARFSSFVRSPAAALTYLRSLAAGRAEHHSGHNPAGGWAIVALLGLIALAAALGWATEAEALPGWLDEAHGLAANALMAIVVLHLVGVVAGSLAHRENLVRAMVTGCKRGRASEAIRRARPWLAGLILIGVVAFWAWQWQSAPPGAAEAAAVSHDNDDDD
jgi:cytochrome b